MLELVEIFYVMRDMLPH